MLNPPRTSMLAFFALLMAPTWAAASNDAPSSAAASAAVSAPDAPLVTRTPLSADDESFVSIKQAIAALGVDITRAEVLDSGRGQPDLLITSTTPMKTFVAAIKQAYSKRRTLPGGVKVAGYARLTRRKSWTVTLRRPLLDNIAEAKTVNGRLEILVRGTSRDRGFKPNGPLLPLPPPVVPGVEPSKNGYQGSQALGTHTLSSGRRQ